MEKIKVGTLLIDNEKIGIVTKVITSGTLNTEHELIKWRNNYEIIYSDGTVSIIGEATLYRLVDRGEVKIL